jgi:hypothetical protein
MLNWKPYDQHTWENSDQRPFNATEKKHFEQLAGKILWLPGVEMQDCWGTVCPPGRNAAVIRVHPDVRHRFERNGLREVGLKIFNLVDGKVMWPSVFKFHDGQRGKLPGLPNAQVQEVLACGTHPDGVGSERGYLVQQWVEGTALDQKIEAGLTADETLQIIDDLFLKIIIPLWGVGTSWWDVRDSNYVVTPAGQLVMIDSDSVGAYADEIVETPTVFAKRNRGSITAMIRYGSLLITLARRLAPRGTKSAVEREVRVLVARHLLPVFVEPYPLPHGWQKTAIRAWQDFRAGYQPLLQPPADKAAPPK